MSRVEENFEEQRSGIRRWLLLAVGLSAAALALISLLTMDEEIIHTLAGLSVPWLLLAVGLAITRWVWAALRIRVLSVPSGVAIPFRDLLKVVFAGNFAGVISPMRAGGVVTEAYLLYRYGLEPGVSAAVIAFGMAVSTFLLLLSMPLALWLGASRINLNFAFRGLLYVAVAACLVFAVAVLAALRRPERTMAEAFRLSCPRLSRRPRLEAWVERISRETARFASFLRQIAALGPKPLLLATLYAALFWGSNLLTMPVVMVALGHPEYFLRSLVAQLVVVTLMPFIPVPGGSGMAEPGFYAVYSSFLQPDLAGLLTLIWRFLDFYLGLLVGGSAFLLALRDLRSMPVGRRGEEGRDRANEDV
jgi:uncharacterized protein (TIRG00374 family)